MEYKGTSQSSKEKNKQHDLKIKSQQFFTTPNRLQQELVVKRHSTIK